MQFCKRSFSDFDYKDVRVVGYVRWSDNGDDSEHDNDNDSSDNDNNDEVKDTKDAKDDFSDWYTFLQVAQSLRNVFAYQSLRAFVHAFVIDGTRMRSLVFDRAGAYGPRSFDLCQ